MKVATIGLDIAKQIFRIHGADRMGGRVLRRKLRTSEVLRFFSDQSPCLVGIEASGRAHYWARELGGLGHTVRLMAPQFIFRVPDRGSVNPSPSGDGSCRHLWAREYWVTTKGIVSDEVWKRYIEEQKSPQPDDDFKAV